MMGLPIRTAAYTMQLPIKRIRADRRYKELIILNLGTLKKHSIFTKPGNFNEMFYTFTHLTTDSQTPFVLTRDRALNLETFLVNCDAPPGLFV